MSDLAIEISLTKSKKKSKKELCAMRTRDVYTSNQDYKNRWTTESKERRCPV